MSDALERRAAAVFESLLSLPTVDRPTVAATACGTDAALLARVRQLLNALTAAADGGFFAGATLDPDDPPGASTPPAVAPVGERAGDHIGPYKLLEQIGEGGFGVVFSADQQRPVRRRVAVKVIKLGMDTREVVARFEAERQALAMMDHPNIARVFDAGSTSAGRPYFVMELVRGSPITEYADKHKLSTRDRVALAAQVCRAVQHAHAKGVIHRDIKPNNVLVTTADDKPVPKVIDFGIAKATQAKLSDQTVYTAHRQLIGTPQYMSPEQADSDGSDIDTRTDVYSLGVLIYELLVGATPLDARSLRAAAFEAMRKMIAETEPPHLATRLSGLRETLATVATNRATDGKQLGRQLQGELDWIVMRALEKDRSRRYDTAAALADDLGRYLSGDAVLAGPVSGTYRLRKTLRRYRAAVVIGSALAAALLLGVAGTTWGLVREARQRRAADAARVESDRSRADAELQQAVTETFRDTDRASTLQFGYISASDAANLYHRAWLRRKQLLGEADPRTFDALVGYISALPLMGRGAEASLASATHLDNIRRSGVKDPTILGRALLLAGNYAATLAERQSCTREGLDLFRGDPTGKSWSDFVALLQSNARLGESRGDTDNTFAETLAEAIAIDRQWIAAHPGSVPLRLQLCRLLATANRFADAEATAREAVAVAASRPGASPVDQDLEDAHHALLDCLTHRHATDEETASVKGWAATLRRLPLSDAKVVRLYTLGSDLDRLARQYESERRLAQAVDVYWFMIGLQRDEGPNPISYSQVLLRFMGTLEKMGDTAGVAAVSGYLGYSYYGDALRQLGEWDPDVQRRVRRPPRTGTFPTTGPSTRPTVLDEMAVASMNDQQLYVTARHFQKSLDPPMAEPFYREYIRDLRATGSARRSDLAAALTDLGTVLARGDAATHHEAEADLREALALRQQLSGPTAPETAAAATTLADLLDRTGRPAEAERVRGEAGLAQGFGVGPAKFDPRTSDALDAADTAALVRHMNPMVVVRGVVARVRWVRNHTAAVISFTGGVTPPFYGFVNEVGRPSVEARWGEGYLDGLVGRSISVRGKLERYVDPANGRASVQIVVSDPSQIEPGHARPTTGPTTRP